MTPALFVSVGPHAVYGGMGPATLTLRPLHGPKAFLLATSAGAAATVVLSFLGFGWRPGQVEWLARAD